MNQIGLGGRDKWRWSHEFATLGSMLRLVGISLRAAGPARDRVNLEAWRSLGDKNYCFVESFEVRRASKPD